ncbi:MAG: general secretion pathway protein GspK [Candidatus Omnitrophica bacterium]|nr:general secretion pathway protein GspK [Candidatus Omnitrophota bacterium]
MARLQTKYLAEAGINYAKAVLKFDKQMNDIDSYDELWRTAFSGNDVDIDSDGLPDSKWFYVEDDAGNQVGRYAVLVEDESAKININVNEVSIVSRFFYNMMGDDAVAEDIFYYQYGEDEKPGIANTDDNSNNTILERDLLDNDADGIIDEFNEGIDEPQEFNIEEPIGDDRPFVVIDELKKISSISSHNFRDIARFITVSSKDQEVDRQGFRRQNINYLKAENLTKILLDKGISSPWQKSVNIIDSLDKNLCRTTIYKHYNLLEAIGGQVTGSWVWVNGLYECDIPQSKGTWSQQNLPLADGEYYCYVYGKIDEPVGDVEIAGLIQESMYNGEAFIKNENSKVTVENGSFSMSIQNNEEFGRTCYFHHVELVPDEITGGTALLSKEIHGVEPIRINEVMVAPKIEKNVISTVVPGGSWFWQSSLFANADPESGQIGEGTWVITGIPDGYYYLRLFGRAGEFIGDVEVGGRTQQSIRDGDYFTVTETVQVSSNQLIIRIQNNFTERTCYFKGVILSQQPDTEYIELVNISEDTVDLSGWILETTGQEGLSAYIPQGTSIFPYGYLVLCVDKEDGAQGVEANNISFSNTWAVHQAVQLDFFRVLDKDFDFLKDNPVLGENYLVLRDAKGSIVEKIEYSNSQIINYSSLERGDPSQQSDSNGDGEFDGWFSTLDLSGGTPGRVNDNNGMKIDEFYNHDIREVLVRNYPASNIFDFIYVPKVYSWQRYTVGELEGLSLADISLIVDSLTSSGVSLSPKDHNLTGWTEIHGGQEGFYSATLEEEGVWQWQNIRNGSYFLAISGEFKEAIIVSYKKADESWQILAQEIIPNEEGLAYCGIINIGEDRPYGTPNNILEIKLENASDSAITHFYYLRLDPLQNVYGRININTAPKEVLLALPNIGESDALKIIEKRPFGNKDGIYKGIGDLFFIDIFRNDPDKYNKLGILSNYITVRSNIFCITARAQVLDQDRVIATQEIKTIIERE